MNFTITRQNLHTGLAAVSASIPTKTTLPVLSNILFETTDDGVRMSGTDLDVAVRVWVPADVSAAGGLTAPGKKLQEIALIRREQKKIICIRHTRYRKPGELRQVFKAFDVHFRNF